MKYKVIRLSEIDGQAIIAGGHPGLLPFAPLMKPPSGVSADAWLRQCLHATEALPLDASTKVDMMAGMAILGGISYELSTVRRIISQKGFLEVRFDADAPGQFAARIAAIADLQRLKQLLREAVQVNNLEGFQRALDAEA